MLTILFFFNFFNLKRVLLCIIYQLNSLFIFPIIFLGEQFFNYLNSFAVIIYRLLNPSFQNGGEGNRERREEECRRMSCLRSSVLRSPRFHPEIPTSTTKIEKGGYRGRSTKFNAKYFVINNAASIGGNRRLRFRAFAPTIVREQFY